MKTNVPVADLDRIAAHVDASIKAARAAQHLLTPTEAEAGTFAAQAAEEAGRALTRLGALGASVPGLSSQVPAEGADAGSPPNGLSGEEMETVFAALAYARDGKLKEWEEEDTSGEMRILYDGDVLPPVGTLDGDILRIGALLLKLKSEALDTATTPQK